MDKNRPLILSIIGKPDSGKTTLILKLLPELRKKRYRVAVAKHCPHGFNLDIEGKDSWRFTQQGAEGTFLSCANQIALIRPKKSKSSIKQRLLDYFSDFDLILMEGYNHEPGMKMIQIIRSSIEDKLSTLEEIVAYISDLSLDTDKPVYKPDDLSGIVSLIEAMQENKKSEREDEKGLFIGDFIF